MAPRRRNRSQPEGVDGSIDLSRSALCQQGVVSAIVPFYFLAQTHLSVPLFLSFTFTPAAYVSFWGHYGLAFVLEFAYLH
eukprot:COSAG01_NODE_685_length_14250_cov_18.752032_6_plen_80_part_00